MELQALHDLQSGRTASTTPTRMDAASQMISTPVATMNCPTRRRAQAMDAITSYQHFRQPKCADAMRASSTPQIARTDYAANAGTTLYGGGASYCAGAYGVGWGPADSNAYDNWKRDCVVGARNYDGVVTAGDVVLMADIRDGTSNTYAIGEKYLCPDNYLNGVDAGDNESMYMGDNQDIGRWGGAGFPPRQDRPGYASCVIFGSAHASGFNMALCDGSVRPISYSIDLEVHGRLASRKDGKPIDGSAF